MFINIHKHTLDITSVENNTIVCLLNEAITEVNNYPDKYFSIGFHPKDIKKTFDFNKFEKILQLRNVPALGEIGLDKNYPDFDKQKQIFEKLLQFAEGYSKPVILHCVKSYSEILYFRKKYNKTPWILHGFRGKWELCKQLTKNNIMISLGAPILKPTDNMLEVISNIPLDSLFFETDEKESDIIAIYNFFAKIRKIEKNDLCQAIKNNFNKIFNIS